MKTGWERSKPLIHPDYHTITKMLQDFLKGTKIAKIEILGGGLSNSNLKIILENEETVVLRIYNDVGSKAKIEKNVLERAANILPVPRVLYHDFTLSHIQYPFIILNWVKGFQLSELFLTGDESSISNAGSEIGKHLAKMHSIRFTSPGFFDEHLNIQKFEITGSPAFLNLINEIINERPVHDNLGTEMISSIKKFTSGQAHLVDDIGNQSSLIHSDFNPLNILIQKEGSSINITGILDWEFSFSNSPLIDIGNMLRYENIQESSFIEPFIVSYLANGGVLPEKWLQKAKLLDSIALLDLVNKSDCGEVRLRDIKGLLNKTMLEWELYSSVQAAIK
ncbi:aminoglycoside phosphotransferase family protein [Bacillus salacetis]|uniref:Aminoglycoside phosphotransferase family protein n=1 Tax=Bacillus salacetis TaxID=2315464 RepID=A0A3A1QPG7_9BACI|nr:aminoglycoside phosphotransferase family protein [Bacillus salacetis]RIW28935.1 aminoglycoside phosphotransferase family protein [Bacillus salacetis]